MLRNSLLNKKASIGETLTWIPATLIIVAAMIIFFILVGLLAKMKIINMYSIQSDVEENSPVLKMKTSLAHISAENKNREIIDEVLENENG
jgi:hypothetical protein